MPTSTSWPKNRRGYEAIIATAGSDTEHQMEIAADALRLPPWDATIKNLSGGEKRRVALCKLLLSKPDMLLLDEPTNHLDAESVEWLEQFLVRFPGTVVAVTHDRYFLDNAAEWILELDRGHGIPWKGNYSSWLEQKEAAWNREEAGRRAHEGDEAGTRMGAPEPEGPPGQEQGASRPLRGTGQRTNTRSATRRRKSSSRRPSASATRSSSSRASARPSATAC
jgi:ATPase subunit of ABC transporter with duplicated ATPase domains